MYAAETWTILATDMKALEAFHICQRQILRIRWSDLVSNVDMQARTGLMPLGEIASRFLPRDAIAMHKRGLCGHAMSACLSVCLSDTFVNCVKTNKHIIKIFAPSGRSIILVFPYQTAYQYRQTLLTGASNAGGVGRNRDSVVFGVTLRLLVIKK